jgi:hypothetical protein
MSAEPLEPGFPLVAAFRVLQVFQEVCFVEGKVFITCAGRGGSEDEGGV